MACARGCCDSPKEHFRSLQFTGIVPCATSQMEKRWEKDMPAYKRLRDDGMQPKNIDGSAKIESGAETKQEVQAGVILNKRQRQQMRSVIDDNNGG